MTQEDLAALNPHYYVKGHKLRLVGSKLNQFGSCQMPPSPPVFFQYQCLWAQGKMHAQKIFRDDKVLGRPGSRTHTGPDLGAPFTKH